MRVRVLKFGGSSLAGTDQITAAAARVQEVHDAGIAPIVVVSAMRGITDQLLALARRVHPEAPGEELDRLLSTGESQVATLLALALQNRGMNARSFNGGEAGILTDPCFGHARVDEVNPTPLAASLAADEIPVVAGFQGMSRDGRITTLGRGGSDITAVALAVAHEADRVTLYRDVEGIHSADPHLLAVSYRLDRLDYDSMIDLAEAGVSILHPQALEMARAHDLPMELRGWREGSGSTYVARENCASHLPVWSISLSPPIALLSIDSIQPEVGPLAHLVSLLDRTDLRIDGDIQASDSRSGACLTLTLPDAEAPRMQGQLADLLREEKVSLSLERRRRRVTLVGKGVASRRVQLAVDSIARRLGPPMAGYRGARHRAYVVPERDGQTWVASLHQELIQR